ncbi:MAG: glycosyltransferase [Chitinophagaceae bacterium]
MQDDSNLISSWGLVRAFRDITDKEKNGWILTIAGNGSMSEDPLLRTDNIRLLSHKSQPELAQLASEGGVFCLCSSDEPWGMVIQEFAAAGMPLLVSHQCGASDLFFKGNGWICNGRDYADIYKQLKQIFAASDEDLFRMAAESHKIAMHPGPEDWAAILCALV